MGAATASSGAGCAGRGADAGPTGEQDLQLTQYLVGGQAGATPSTGFRYPSPRTSCCSWWANTTHPAKSPSETKRKPGSVAKPGESRGPRIVVGPGSAVGRWPPDGSLALPRVLGVEAASGQGCRQTGFGPPCPPRRARSQRSLPEAATLGDSLGPDPQSAGLAPPGFSGWTAGVQ